MRGTSLLRSLEVRAVDRYDPALGEGLLGRDRAVGVDRTARVADHNRIKPGLTGVERGEADAIIESQSTKEEPRKTAFAAVAREAGGRRVIVFQQS